MAEQRRTSQPPDRRTRTPRLKLPAGATDCHFHIFGPQTRFWLRPDRDLEFEDCTLDDLMRTHDAIGISRGLIVQSFQHGHNYEYLLHALTRAPKRFRAVAMPAPDITDGELAILDAAGVKGVRWAAHAAPGPDARTAARVAALGWSNHFFVRGEEQIARWEPQILATRGNLVLDHMGNPPPSKGLDSPEFKFTQRLLDTGRCWTKLSPRFSEQETLPFADTLPFIRRLVERYPDRLLWGTDWPHPHYAKPMPNDGDLVDLVSDWVPDAAVRQKVFVDNPAKLFAW